MLHFVGEIALKSEIIRCRRYENQECTKKLYKTLRSFNRQSSYFLYRFISISEMLWAVIIKKNCDVTGCFGKTGVDRDRGLNVERCIVYWNIYSLVKKHNYADLDEKGYLLKFVWIHPGSALWPTVSGMPRTWKVCCYCCVSWILQKFMLCYLFKCSWWMRVHKSNTTPLPLSWDSLYIFC